MLDFGARSSVRLGPGLEYLSPVFEAAFGEQSARVGVQCATVGELFDYCAAGIQPLLGRVSANFGEGLDGGVANGWE